jgi:hypothetical protein
MVEQGIVLADGRAEKAIFVLWVGREKCDEAEGGEVEAPNRSRGRGRAEARSIRPQPVCATTNSREALACHGIEIVACPRKKNQINPKSLILMPPPLLFLFPSPYRLVMVKYKDNGCSVHEQHG